MQSISSLFPGSAQKSTQQTRKRSPSGRDPHWSARRVVSRRGRGRGDGGSQERRTACSACSSGTHAPSGGFRWGRVGSAEILW